MEFQKSDYNGEEGTMGVLNDDYKTLEITLMGYNNRTLKGILNFTALDLGEYDKEEEYDSKGAATFVVVVIMVYGLSIVLMIGSLAKKNMKKKNLDLEEKQINKYLDLSSDLKEKGAKDNYRQLKKEIIVLVNKTPITERKNYEAAVKSINDAATVRNNLLRSIIAVGSPSAARISLTKNVSDTDNCPVLQSQTNTTGNLSDAESVQVLLDEEEEVFPLPPPPLVKEPPNADHIKVVRPLAGPFQHPAVHHYGTQSHTAHIANQSPSATILAPTPTDEQKQARSDQVTIKSNVPMVVISDPSGGVKKCREQSTSIQKLSDRRRKSVERDNNIICNDHTLREVTKSHNLSMDPDGNLWQLQDIPDMGIRSKPHISPCPSISTPGSIGYESILVSRTPSPSLINTMAPFPGLSGTASRGRKDVSYSPVLGITKQRERSRSPRNISNASHGKSHVVGDPYDRSHSPGSHSHAVSYDQKHGIILTSHANLMPGGRKSPYYELDSSRRSSYQNDIVYSRRGSYRDDLVDASRKIETMSISPDGDSGELEQITTV